MDHKEPRIQLLVVSTGQPRDTTAFEVREALREAGCVVCRLTLRAVGRYIQSLAYEQVNDIAVRKELRRARGFCNRHAYQWLREARSTLGTALIYRDVLKAALNDLTVGPARGGVFSGLLRPAKRHASCLACRAQREAEARYMAALVALLTADAVLDQADGLCRRHALEAIRAGGPVADHTRKLVEALIHDLDQLVRKEDYRFRDEPRTDSERSAPARAIAWAAAIEGLVD
jgi:hypothetical protein